MTTRFYLVRHGETEWNQAKVKTGQLDSPLTKLGVAQMEHVGRRLAQGKIDAIYCSDLGRAKCSASIIGSICKKPTVADARLRERALGMIEGLTADQFRECHPIEAERRKLLGKSYLVPGEESRKDRSHRVVAALEDYLHRHPGGKIVVVTHRGTIIALLQHVLAAQADSSRKILAPNGSVSTFSSSRGIWMLESWGEVPFH